MNLSSLTTQFTAKDKEPVVATNNRQRDEIQQTLKNLQKQSALKNTLKQLPLWPEGMRGAPNEVLRSSLFTARVRGERENYKDETLFVLGKAEITYRGEELRTFDEDVWLQVIHLAKQQNLNECIEFTPYSMIRALKWVKKNRKGKVVRPSVNHYNRLKKCLSRMQATSLMIKSGRLNKGCTVSLIRKFEFIDDSKGVKPWKIWIEKEMEALYGEVEYTQLEWEQRSKLTPTAKRLHGYWASHKKPFDVKISNLYKMCKIKTPEKNFKQKMKIYLDELVKIGFLDSWSFIAFESKNAKVRVVRQR